MADPVAFWTGEGGDEYTVRNVVEPASRVQGFGLAFPDVREIESVLEVGANCGHNLYALDGGVCRHGTLYAGIDVCPAVCDEAMAPILRGSATNIPAFDASFDLVFTCGVLIHVPPADLPKAYDELVRVSRRYVLIMEYYASEPTPIRWRGQDGLLWKRNFGKEMSERHPELNLEATGFLGKDAGFDDVTWWRWRKP